MDIRGHREVTLPMIVAAGGMGERRGGAGTAMVDWGRGVGQSGIFLFKG